MRKKPKVEKHGRGFRIRYVEYGSQQTKSQYFDRKEDAEFEAGEVFQNDQKVKRGLRGLAPIDRTFDQLAEYWIKNVCPEKRSGKHDKSTLAAHLQPFFGGTLLRNITAQQVDEFKAILREKKLGEKTQHNILTLLISMLNKAIDIEWITKRPVIKKMKLKEMSFRYLKTKEEIHCFLNAAKSKGEHVELLYSFAILTGLRVGEVAGLRKSDIDFENGIITVQRSYEGPTKGGRPRNVPVPIALRSRLIAWNESTLGNLVFPNERGNMHHQSARIFQEVLHDVLDKAGFSRNTHPKRKHYISFHDLRHTYASHQVMNGCNLYVLRDLMGHENAKTTQKYAHLAPQAFLEEGRRLSNLI